MRPHHALVPALVATSLACGGLFISDHDLAMVASALDSVDPDQAVPLFIVGGTELGLVNARCGTCVEQYGHASAEMRRPIGANMLLETSCFCPSTCASDLLEEVAPLEPLAQMARVAEACDAAGPDPVFADDTLPLRASADIIDYTMVRMLAESLEGRDELVDMRDKLAVGLALRGNPYPEPTDELSVTGHSPEPFAALGASLEACQDGLAHRLVVDPTGAVVGLDGPGCDDVLTSLTLPGEGWRVVDLAWTPEGIAAHLDDAPVDDAPVDDAPIKEPEGSPGSPGAGPTPKPAPGKPITKPGRPTVRGSLSSDIIARVMRRSANQFRYCYERALTKNPTLEGKLVVAFTIGADGSVTSAKAQEGFDQEVDSCVVGRIQRLTFPAPSGGGIVAVNYPFVFSPG